MTTLRRLINICLMLAFASYGIVVAASAHGHGDHDRANYALHALATDVFDADYDHHHEHNAGEDASTSGNPDSDIPHGGYHVHAVAAFIAVDEPVSIAQPATITSTVWADLPSLSVSGLFSPLKKPPRILL